LYALYPKERISKHIGANLVNLALSFVPAVADADATANSDGGFATADADATARARGDGVAKASEYLSPMRLMVGTLDTINILLKAADPPTSCAAGMPASRYYGTYYAASSSLLVGHA
jgi:hypothetical protein